MLSNVLETPTNPRKKPHKNEVGQIMGSGMQFACVKCGTYVTVFAYTATSTNKNQILQVMWG